MLHGFSTYNRVTAKQTMIPLPTIDVELIKNLRISLENFNKTFIKLCETWWGINASIPESEGKMFITNILGSKLQDPTILAIIADDLNCFERYPRKKGDIYYLEFCCACGAEKIIREIYLKDDKKQCLIDSEDAIAFAVSSGNAGLALDLARESKKLGKKTAGLLALYSAGNYKNVDAISAIFSDSQNVAVIMHSDEINYRASKMIQDRAEQDAKSKFLYANRCVTNSSDLTVKSKAHYELYLFHHHGWGGVVRNPDLALKHLQEATNLGYPRAGTVLARRYLEEKNFDAAKTCISECSQKCPNKEGEEYREMMSLLGVVDTIASTRHKPSV